MTGEGESATERGSVSVARAFDVISTVYDTTRDPLAASTFDALARSLRAEGVHNLLEVGVGTGRVAAPLARSGFQVTGVDASRGMLSRARTKGLPGLVRGSAYRLPFRDRCFDAALFVHVLHVLDDPERALGEAGRVAPPRQLALVHPVPRPANGPPSPESVRKMFFEELRARGVAVQDRGGPVRRERELLARHPPDRLEVLAERDVTEPVARRLDRLAKPRAHGWSLHIPAVTMEEVAASVRERLGATELTYHQIEALAVWSPAPTNAAPP